jgi:glyoxylase-like metal-dependent hydrolase (beta-lactamase superfamily II)
MPFDRVTLLNSGYCTQLGGLAGRATWGPTRFHAVFIYLEHPEHGISIIDTGYGPFFREATQPFPERLYRWLTPMHLDPRGDARSILQAGGFRPDLATRLFVSHFHADHIAGLRHFDRTSFVYRRAALDHLLNETVGKQVHDGFLARLVPDDFAARGQAIDEATFVQGSASLGEFRIHDYWGDGDLLLVDLPGHAIGHTGYVIRTATEQIFYVVDACWDRDAMLRGRSLPWPARRLQFSYQDYVQTQEKLRRFAARQECLMLACHCPRTQEHVGKG